LAFQRLQGGVEADWLSDRELFAMGHFA
jgi:hypothetical protein